MTQGMLFLKARCQSQQREADHPSEATPYLWQLATGSKYTPQSQISQQTAFWAYNNFHEKKRSEKKEYDRFIFIAHADTINKGWRIGKDLDAKKFEDDVTPKINKTMMDSGNGQPRINIYLPGCQQAAVFATAKLLGLERGGSEDNIHLYSSGNDNIHYDGPGNLNGDKQHDKRQIEKLEEDKGIRSRYGPKFDDKNTGAADDRPMEWQSRCAKPGKKGGSKKESSDSDYEDGTAYGEWDWR